MNTSALRILHVIPHLAVSSGGPTTALIGLACAQRQLDNEVRVLCTAQHGEVAADGVALLQSMGIAVESVPVRGALGRGESLAAAVRGAVAQADVVHLHGMWEEVLWRTSRECIAQGRPYWLRPCGMLDPWSLAQSRWRKRIYLALRGRRMLRDARAVHFVSAGEARLARPLVPEGHAVMLHNGVDAPVHDAMSRGSYWEERLPCSAAERIVLFLGRLHPKKNLQALLRAFRRVEAPDLRLVVAGPIGDYGREVIVPLAAEDPRVQVPGKVAYEERFEAFAGADLLVLPSLQENFGNVVIEALVMGTPVLLSRGVNIAEELQRNGCAQVCGTSGDELVAALQEWSAAPAPNATERRRRMDFARARYGWPALAQQWDAIYREGVSACANGH